MTAASRRPSLAWRLGLILGAVVLGVLLIAGVVVNRVVSGGFETVIAGQQQQRLDDAADNLADRLDRPARVLAVARRLANNLGGEVRVLSNDGTTLAAFGRQPDGAVARYTAAIEADGEVLGTLEADLPAQVGDRGFLPLFNVTLVVGGVLSVLGIALASTFVATRLTRPLRDVADAARRIGAGETAARATGGDDRESAELADAFNAMADRLERSEMLRRRAASDIAHDLATPATVLVSQLQAMVDGVVPADRRESRGGTIGGLRARQRGGRAQRPRERRGRAAPGAAGGGGPGARGPRGRARARRAPARARAAARRRTCRPGRS